MKPGLLLSVLLLTAAVASGCATKADSSSTSDVPTEIQTVAVTKETGAIRGIVFDPAIHPLANVTVKLGGVNETVKTSATGSFSFTDLKAGTYFLMASKAGYQSAQTSHDVVAGDDQPPLVKIQLLEDASGRPFLELQEWKAFLQCGVWAVAVTTNPCFATGSDNVHEFVIGGNGTPQKALLEAVWDGTQPLGNWLDLSFDGACKGANVASPAAINATRAEIVKCGAGQTQLMVRVFPGATPGTPPVPTVVVNQDYAIYMTYFYGFDPRPDYTFVKDGACDPITVCQ